MRRVPDDLSLDVKVLHASLERVESVNRLCRQERGETQREDVRDVQRADDEPATRPRGGKRQGAYDVLTSLPRQTVVSRPASSGPEASEQYCIAWQDKHPVLASAIGTPLDRHNATKPRID